MSGFLGGFKVVLFVAAAGTAQTAPAGAHDFSVPADDTRRSPTTGVRDVAYWQQLLQVSSGTADDPAGTAGLIMQAALNRIFQQHADDVFEVGYESEFEGRVLDLLEQNPDVAIAALDKALSVDQHFDLLAEALRAVGRQPTLFAAADPLRMLLHGLRHACPHVRDCAALALCDLREKRAIKPLRAAAEQERSRMMKRNLLQVADELAEL